MPELREEVEAIKARRPWQMKPQPKLEGLLFSECEEDFMRPPPFWSASLTAVSNIVGPIPIPQFHERLLIR